jgi:hypothetical protein
MRALAALLLMSSIPAQWLGAQVDYYGRLGATFATPLVEDRIAQDQIEIGQNLAPTLVLGASMPIAPRHRAGLEAAFTTSGYESTSNGTANELGTLRTGSITLGLDGPVASNVRWRGGVGLIAYWPSEEQGIFLQGGTRRFLAGAGIDYRPRIMAKWDLMASLRYDFHRFTTDELRARGFAQHQGVQRVSVSLGLARGGQ